MDELIHRPIGDLLEELLDRGHEGFPRYVAAFRGAPAPYRISVLLGGLCLGEAVEAEIHDRLTRRDSPDKQRFLLGLGETGHPLAEGYLARVLRERPSEEAMAAALSGLGRIRGRKSLPLVVEALDHPFLFQNACDALASYGGEEAARALFGRIEEPAAFRALARMGAPIAREAFVAALERGEPWDAEGARGLGNLGEPEGGAPLVPYLQARDPHLARAAFEAYAQLGAPQGSEPLLQAAQDRFEPWMLPALAGLADPAVHRFVAARLEPPRSRGLLGRWLRRKGRRSSDPRAVYRCLRTAEDPEVVAVLVERLRREEDPVAVRTLLANRALREDPRYAGEVLAVWRRSSPVACYAAARVLLQLPTLEFLAEAGDWLQRPDFIPLDGAPASADPERLLDAYARENNPSLLVGGFLDSGLVDLDHLEKVLRRRFSSRATPRPTPPAQRFSAPEEVGVARILEALGRAHSAKGEALARLWNLLAQEHDRGDPLLDLFLCWTEVTRAGIQRALVQGFPNALGRFIQGKTDRHLPEMDTVEGRLPQEGPLARSLRESVERARRALMAECRDMALLTEGSQRGDMVLIESLT
ncbi:MAG: hypothetical protein Kow0092_08810 [Deferrisomatales bacterium]